MIVVEGGRIKLREARQQPALGHCPEPGKMAGMTKHCWKCGREYKLGGSPGRSETCDCGADLKVCLNCLSYDRTVAYQCRDRRAEPVFDKHLANYCEYFELARRMFVPPTEDKSREAQARDKLKGLLGD